MTEICPSLLVQDMLVTGGCRASRAQLCPRPPGNKVTWQMAPALLMGQRDLTWAELSGLAAGAGGHREQPETERFQLPGDKEPGDNTQQGHQDWDKAKRQSSWCRRVLWRASLLGALVACYRLVAPALPAAAAQSCQTASSLQRLPWGTNSPKLLPFHPREGDKGGQVWPEGLQDKRSGGSGSQKERGAVTSPRRDTAGSPLPGEALTACSPRSLGLPLQSHIFQQS